MKELGLSPVWVRRHGSQPIALAQPAVDMAMQAEVVKLVAPSAEAGLTADRAAQIHAMGWMELKSSASACTVCVLHKARKQAVFGVGDEKAEWFFVGEGPGAEEDERGEPFVGQAGKLLDNMLAAIALQRGKNVYIANVVKCRPPSNRNPEPGEAQACEPYLTRQIELIRPRLIVALGKVAASNLLGIDATLGSMRGRVHHYRGTPLVVTYHPAYLLRTPADKARSWEDLCFAIETMNALKQQQPAPN